MSNVLLASLLSLYLVSQSTCWRSGKAGTQNLQQPAPSALPNNQKTDAEQTFLRSDSHQAAELALEEYRKDAARDLKSNGLNSLKDVSKTSLGDSFPIFFIRNDSLQKFDKDSNVRQLLTDLNRVAYLITVEGQTKSLVEVVKRAEGWEPVVISDPLLAKRIDEAKRLAQSAFHTNKRRYFLIQIDANPITIVLGESMESEGPGGDNNFKVIPLFEHPAFNRGSNSDNESFDPNFIHILPESDEINGNVGTYSTGGHAWSKPLKVLEALKRLAPFAKRKVDGNL